MTTLYLDTFSGISGDMTIGLLVDLVEELLPGRRVLGRARNRHDLDRRAHGAVALGSTHIILSGSTNERCVRVALVTKRSTEVLRVSQRAEDRLVQKGRRHLRQLSAINAIATRALADHKDLAHRRWLQM